VRGSRARRSGDARAVVGAGLGGLAASIVLARAGLDVTVLEKETKSGGKARTQEILGRSIDAGPTVLTLRWAFDELFDQAGASFESEVELERVEVLARHAWPGGVVLDLFADAQRSEDEIGRVFGASQARAFREFSDDCRKIHELTESNFLRSQRLTVPGIVTRFGAAGLRALGQLEAHRTMWASLQGRFSDPRLVQLFGRYATYVGSSPYEAPATLNVISHVEAAGVFRARGGTQSVVAALEGLARRCGVRFEHGVEVERVLVSRGRAHGVRRRGGPESLADVIVFNGDVSALGRGLLGTDVAHAAPATSREGRSLSAVTYTQVGRLTGLPLAHHNVFFASDYRAEFDALFGESRVPTRPTVYVCAQDRGRSADSVPAAERLLVLINAPATGDLSERWGPAERGASTRARDATLASLGVTLHPEAEQITTPREFEALFPGTGGALYGPRSRGSLSILGRVGAKTRIPGLYLAGGSVHPGAGMPMAVLSGRLAAARALDDL
jgi:1-hydroxycarotenoid 3,4-desaturase